MPPSNQPLQLKSGTPEASKVGTRALGLKASTLRTPLVSSRNSPVAAISAMSGLRSCSRIAPARTAGSGSAARTVFTSTRFRSPATGGRAPRSR